MTKRRKRNAPRRSSGTRAKAAARKITAQIKKLKTKRRQLYR